MHEYYRIVIKGRTQLERKKYNQIKSSKQGFVSCNIKVAPLGLLDDTLKGVNFSPSLEKYNGFVSTVG